MMPLTLSKLALTYQDVQNLPSTLRKTLDRLGFVFNEIMDLGLAELLTRAPALVLLDLEAGSISTLQGRELIVYRERRVSFVT